MKLSIGSTPSFALRSGGWAARDAPRARRAYAVHQLRTWCRGQPRRRPVQIRRDIDSSSVAERRPCRSSRRASSLLSGAAIDYASIRAQTVSCGPATDHPGGCCGRAGGRLAGGLSGGRRCFRQANTDCDRRSADAADRCGRTSLAHTTAWPRDPAAAQRSTGCLRASNTGCLRTISTRRVLASGFRPGLAF